MSTDEEKIQALTKIELIDNSNGIGKLIYSTLQDQVMTDICLEVNGIEYPCHRLFLGISSDVFRAMLIQNNWCEKNEKRITLHENPECYRVFPAFLRYFYTHQIEISIDNVMPIIILADKYMVKELLTSCIQYLITHVAQATLRGQLASWLEYACSTRTYGNDVTEITSFVCYNFEFFLTHTPLLSIHLEVFLALLRNTRLVVRDEQTVFNWAVKWLQEHRSTSSTDFEQIVQQVLSCVRFPMMMPNQLAELLLHPFCREFRDIFVSKMTLGMAFHKGVKNQLDEILSLPDGELQFLPRLYTTNAYSTMLTIENVPKLPPYHTSTLVFMSHVPSEDRDNEDRLCEWVVEVYPKGVWIKKCLLIHCRETREVPEHVIKTVRLSIFCMDPPSGPEPLKVKVGILIYGQDDGIEYIRKVVEKVYNFSEEDRLLQFDNLVPYSEWNDIETIFSGYKSSYLVDTDRELFKLRIIITPLCKPCDIKAPL